MYCLYCTSSGFREAFWMLCLLMLNEQAQYCRSSKQCCGEFISRKNIGLCISGFQLIKCLRNNVGFTLSVFLQWFVSLKLQLQQLWVSVQTIESVMGICLQLCTNLHQCVTIKPHLKWVGGRCHKACLWGRVSELIVLFLIASFPHPERKIIKIATCWTREILDCKCDLSINKPQV